MTSRKKMYLSVEYLPLHLMESPELDHIPQVKLALSSLNELSARLLLADDELNNKYANLVRQSQGNKTVNELNFDLKSVEPPNLGSSCLNLLHSFIIMNKHSSRPTSAPFSFTSVPPPPISASSAQGILPTFNSRDAPRDLLVGSRSYPTPPPGYTTESPSFPGIPEGDSRLPPLVHPMISSRSSNTSQNSIQSSIHTPTSLSMSSSPAPEPVTQSEVAPTTGATATNPTTGATATNPTTGATATNPTSSRNTGVVKKSTTSYSTGANLNAGQPGDYTPAKKGDLALVASLQKDHPSLSTRQALDYVKELRKSNNGKLSGMSTKDILKKLDGFIQRDKDIEGDANAEDINCSICLEDMSEVDSLYLNPCRHRFHTACINQWLDSPGGAGSTCPMCRNYIVKEEEFPNLRPTRRF